MRTVEIDIVGHGPENISVPDTDERYFYIHACMSTHQFLVKETSWTGGMSDRMRLVKGNIYHDIKSAEDAAVHMNRFIEALDDAMPLQYYREKKKEMEGKK